MNATVLLGWDLPEDADPKARVKDAKERLAEREHLPWAAALKNMKPKFRHAKGPNAVEVELTIKDAQDVPSIGQRMYQPLHDLGGLLGVQPSLLSYIEIGRFA